MQPGKRGGRAGESLILNIRAALLRQASPAYRGWPRRGRVWRGPGATFRSAQNYETPHIRHGLRPMTPSPQGEGFSLKPLSPTSNDRTLPPSPASPVSAYRIRRAGHAAAPIHKFDSPYRPSSGPFVATFPQGKANPRQVGSLLQSPTVHPLRATQVWPTSPYTPGGSAPLGGYTKSPAAGFPRCRWSFICFLGFTRCLLAR